jgi:hypothetical protein
MTKFKESCDMNIVKFVKELTFEELKEMFDNYRELERNGSIGDCLLRSKTEEFITENEFSGAHTIIWMDRLMKECYKRVAEKAMEQGFTL